MTRASLTCAPQGCPATTVHLGTELEEISAATSADGVFVLTDERLAKLHATLCHDRSFCVEGGETAKTMASLHDVLCEMARRGLRRDSHLIALGGGSIGDLGGLAASLYLRGIQLTQIPTTLLAMLDSSVGGKTAINLPEGKNLAGTFWPAQEVFIHTGFVETLSPEEFDSGLGEALKMAIGLSPELFDLLDQKPDAVRDRDLDTLTEVVRLALRAKIDIVESDPQEQLGKRQLLNLGHTIGHALEADSGYRLVHGKAVARGTHFAIDLAQQRGAITDEAAERCHALLSSYGFEAYPIPDYSRLGPFIERDKKAAQAGLHFVLPTGLGSSKTELLSFADLEAATC
ncbi:MAG: 3-dehydroquinate synthase family protein [Planctomycetota bacterium]|nr:3-dehydroquinate synthase family protein [Planctomycetota bacterium]